MNHKADLGKSDWQDGFILESSHALVQREFPDCPDWDSETLKT